MDQFRSIPGYPFRGTRTGRRRSDSSGIIDPITIWRRKWTWLLESRTKGRRKRHRQLRKVRRTSQRSSWRWSRRSLWHFRCSICCGASRCWFRAKRMRRGSISPRGLTGGSSRSRSSAARTCRERGAGADRQSGNGGQLEQMKAAKAVADAQHANVLAGRASRRSPRQGRDGARPGLRWCWRRRLRPHRYLDPARQRAAVEARPGHRRAA